MKNRASSLCAEIDSASSTKMKNQAQVQPMLQLLDVVRYTLFVIRCSLCARCIISKPLALPATPGAADALASAKQRPTEGDALASSLDVVRYTLFVMCALYHK
jgi:hypothetical protein